MRGPLNRGPITNPSGLWPAARLTSGSVMSTPIIINIVISINSNIINIMIMIIIIISSSSSTIIIIIIITSSSSRIIIIIIYFVSSSSSCINTPNGSSSRSSSTRAPDLTAGANGWVRLTQFNSYRCRTNKHSSRCRLCFESSDPAPLISKLTQRCPAAANISKCYPTDCTHLCHVREHWH